MTDTSGVLEGDSYRRRVVEARAAVPGVTIVPTTEDVGALWDLWVTEAGGEGIGVLQSPPPRGRR